jgi:hypothetical protein
VSVVTKVGTVRKRDRSRETRNAATTRLAGTSDARRSGTSERSAGPVTAHTTFASLVVARRAS